MEFPTHPDSVTVDWLDGRLRTAGMIPNDCRLEALTWEPIGTGQVGDSVRFHLGYDQPMAGPATLAGKFPAADPTSRATAATLGLYAKEVRFYRELAPLLDVRVPAVFAAELGEDQVEFVLIFEDLAPALGGNQLAGCSGGEARAAIGQLAALHAASWNNSEFIARDWLQTPSAVVAQIQALYPQAHAVFRERYASALEPEFMAVCDALNEARADWSERIPINRSLVHGDFRLDNMLFGIRGGTEEIAILDWQTLSVGNPLTDVGYFLGTGIGDALRRVTEDELLNLYCSEMTRRGVPLDRAAIWDDYVIGALSGISTAVFSSAFVVRTERGDANFLSMARGGCALALQHGAIGKLGKAA